MARPEPLVDPDGFGLTDRGFRAMVCANDDDEDFEARRRRVMRTSGIGEFLHRRRFVISPKYARERDDAEVLAAEYPTREGGPLLL